MRAFATTLAVLSTSLVAGLAPAVAQTPGRNGLIYFTTPDLVDNAPDCGVATVTVSGRGYNCLFNGLGFDAAVSPSRRLIAESVEVGDSDQIFTESLDGRHVRQLTHPDQGQNLHPRFSPDGRRILFFKRFLGVDGVYVMNSDGSGQRRLTSDGGDDAVFSPDGRRIAYEGSAGPSVGLVVADSGGGSPRLLAADSVVTTGPLGGPTTSLTVHNNQPDFSPNGRQILFTRSVVRANGNGTTIAQSQLEIVNVDGTGARALTKPTVLDSRGSWSPDGREIAYQEASHGGTVWVMNANGTGRREVAHGHYPFFSSIQGPIPARPRISVHVLKLNPSRSCFSHDDGWGALVTTTATKQTLYTVSLYLDGRLGFQSTKSRSGDLDAGFLRRGHHRVRIVVSDSALHDGTTRTINFQFC